MDATTILTVIAALAAVIIGSAGALNYAKRNGISIVRVVAAGAYTLSFLGLFFTWMSVTTDTSCIGAICFGSGSTSTANAFQIAQSINSQLQSSVQVAVNEGNSGASSIQSLIQSLAIACAIESICVIIAYASILITMSPQAKDVDSSSPLHFAPTVTILCSVACVIAIVYVFNDLSQLSSNYTDNSVSWGMGIGEYITGIGVIVGAIARLRDRTVGVTTGNGTDQAFRTIPSSS